MWEILSDPDFAEWLLDLTERQRREILAHVQDHNLDELGDEGNDEEATPQLGHALQARPGVAQQAGRRQEEQGVEQPDADDHLAGQEQLHQPVHQGEDGLQDGLVGGAVV